VICSHVANIDSDYLTDFELMILLSILRVGDEAYGVPIAREMETTGGRTVVLSAVYAALDRLEENGLVSSSLGEPTPERGGRAKRFFKQCSWLLRCSPSLASTPSSWRIFSASCFC
jgi:hypothetical protein